MNLNPCRRHTAIIHYSLFTINLFYHDSVAMDLEPALAIQAYGLGQELPLRVLKDAARQALGRVVRENVNGLLGDYRADVAVDIREKRRCAGSRVRARRAREHRRS